MKINCYVLHGIFV
jgi:hypothetical protein